MKTQIEYIADHRQDTPDVVTDTDAEDAFRLLLKWIGENPEREGLINTPARTVRAWKEYFSGYNEDPRAYLQTTFEETEGFHGLISLGNIRLESFCEHHLAPIVGEAFIAYVPRNRVVGISKLARVMEGFAKRLQIQEKLTAQIAHTINDVLEPEGVAVAIRAGHGCITSRGIHKPEATMVTITTLGCFETDQNMRTAFMGLMNHNTK